MRLVSWNVNGLRAALGKGFLESMTSLNPDIICLQETKMRPEQADFELEGFHRFWNSADKAGYSGTAIFTRTEPINVTYDFGEDVHRHEGRIITAEYEAVAKAIGEKLSRGTTFLHGEGAYSGKQTKVILTAVKRQQLAELKELVTDMDPNAFIIVQEAHQVLGDGFSKYSKDEL